MTAGMHRRPNQRRDAIATRIRHARKRLRRAVRNLLWAAGDRLCARKLTFSLGHQVVELGWKLSGPFAMTPVQPIPTTPISRRATPRAAGGATGPTPTAVAPEAPAPTGAPVRDARAGASPQSRDAAPEGVTAPATPGAATRPDWAWYPGTGPWPAHHDQRGQHPFDAPVYGHRDGQRVRRPTAVIRNGHVSQRETGQLEALAMPAPREWATDQDTLTRALDGLRALEVP
jgi:hypothetical protein